MYSPVGGRGSPEPSCGAFNETGDELGPHEFGTNFNQTMTRRGRAYLVCQVSASLTGTWLTYELVSWSILIC